MTEDTFRVVCTGFMKSVHVELSDKAIHLVVAKIAREHNLLEFVDVLDDELRTRWSPVSNFSKLIILNQKRITLKI
jgi:hypothetical protein